MIRTAIVTVILAMLELMIFCASYLWDRVVELEDRLKVLSKAEEVLGNDRQGDHRTP